jgi:predicted Zn-dependent protease
MEDEIIVFNGSDRISDKSVLDRVKEIAEYRDIAALTIECKDELERISEDSYSYNRGQVDETRFLDRFHNKKIARKFSDSGKIILIDHDLYDGSDPRSNWVFGGFVSSSIGLGYILLSTAKLQNQNHESDLIRHELGHMFGAAPSGRNNTYELLGSHCSNDLCVMQQKMDVDSAVKYANKRARKKAPIFCGQCEDDITNFDYRRED